MRERTKQFWRDVHEHFKSRNYIWKFKLQVCLPIFIGLLILDIITKQLAFHLLSHDPYAPEVKFLDGFINFKFVVNKGIAFGANADNLVATIIGAVLITMLAFTVFLYINNKTAAIGLIMITCGGVGNLIDRMWNQGGVVDFLAWILFPPYSIFNLSDTWVTFGVVVLVLAIIVEIVRFYRNRARSNREESNTIND
ncbi:lipoprotein signal peptidase [Spiroplasma sp. NBRC 100390]|uniref:signal peptidase II n=1 Tax=unclassified Spiroplasma TaxID=2637901 RepID=UPI0008927EA0|nr:MULTISPECIES: signal peptidase II [unclassified Spiroplasma]AOX44044.1 lipoprotein signal peptidase [Spiroplasma sp. TU-14]APE13514.1 lipoprotein signal peptidase [Spiroplasma sp. NBRC 100390]